jgi:hypothetical protein
VDAVIKIKVAIAAIIAGSLGVSTNNAAGAPQLSPEAVRAFVQAQNRAWSARDFARYYATFGPQAEIVTIRTTPGGKVTRTVKSPAEDRNEAERFFASTRATIHETDRIEKIEIAPDGRHARVRWIEEASLAENGKPRLLHATAEEELESRNGRIVALRLTETR